MTYVDPETVKKITDIAEQLPPELQDELLNLVASWKPETRTAHRWHFVEMLSFSTATSSHQGRIHNISSSGVFIDTSDEFNLDDEVHLVLSFIVDPKPLELSGHVIRKTAHGIGIKFNLSGAKSQRLEDLLHSHSRILQG